MNTQQIIDQCANLGITLTLEAKGLGLGGNTKALKPELIELIKSNKQELIEYIQDFLPSNLNNSGITKVGRDSDLPLSPAQMQLWLVNEIQGQSPECNMPGACRIDGEFHFEQAQKALIDVIKRHEILRTCYREIDGSPVQIIQNEFTFNIQHHDLTSLSAQEKENALQKLLEQDINTPFDLEKDLMIRASYIEMGSSDKPHGVLLFNTHHIAFDGWSMNVLHKEFFTLYQSYVCGIPTSLPEVQIQYADYAYWQRKQETSDTSTAQFDYWKNKLRDLPLVHSLPLDFKRPEIKLHKGAIVSKNIDATTAQKLKALASQFKLTPFMLTHAALALILSRHSGTNDIVIGTPVANRLNVEIESLIGFFVNTLVLRADTQHESLSAYLNHIRDVHIEAQSNQSVTVNQIIERLDVPRNSSYAPLFQIMLTTENDFSAGEQALSMELAGSKLTSMEPDSVAVKSQFDLDVNIQLGDSGGLVKWTYDTALFNEHHISELNSHLCQLLISLAQLTEQNLRNTKLSQISMYDEKQTKALVNHLKGVQKPFNPDTCIQTLFESKTENTPDAIAVVHEEEQLTYRQLNEKANQLAHYLHYHYSIKPDTLIGVCLERSCNMIVAIMGILKAGAAYVPLDPTYPHARLVDMVEDANLSLIISQEKVNQSIDFDKCNILSIDEADYSGCSTDNISPADIDLKAEHLAYVIYTSGSTGRPKGVMVEHRNLQHFILDTNHRYKLSGKDNVLQFSTMNFDTFVEEMFATLCSGASLVIRNENCLSSAEAFSQFCEQYKVSVLTLPTSSWLHLNAESQQVSYESLRLVILGGEALPVDSVNRYFKSVTDVEMINSYGPTETTVAATGYHINASVPENVLPIGQANVNTSLLILNDDLIPVPCGTVGELYIGGAGVARGYLNRPELTEERFIDNPYYSASDVLSSPRLYKTGDLVRHGKHGNVEFIGRIDDQVKIRGFRIELGEIENTLSAREDIKACMVLAVAKAGGPKQLVAYIQPETSESKNKNIINEVRADLLSQLPSYMVPAAYAVVETWPLTPNGKVDKKALPEPEVASLQGEYIAPQTDLETQLQTLWAEILNIPSDSLSIDANFFDIGGHSLLAVKLVSKIRAHLQQEISIAQVFSAPTIKRMAECLTQPSQQQLRSQVTPIPRNEQSHYPLSFSQQRLWFIDQMNGNSSEYNMPVALRVKGTIDTHAVVEAFTQIIQRHEVLRTVYVNTDDGALQHIQQDFSFVLNLHDLTSFDGEEQDKQLQNLIEEDTKAPFDLSQDLMLRASFVLLNQGETPEKQDSVLLFNMHHIASDGWSLEVLTREFMTHYKAITAGEKVQLPQLDIQYVDYALWQRQWLQGEVLDKQLRYWEKQLADTPPVHSLPLDKTRPEVKQHQGDIITKTLPADISKKLIKLAKQHQVTPFMLLHAALALVLSRHSNSQDIVIGTPVANRLQDELAPLIGFFVNTLVLRVNTKQDSLNDYLAHVRQTHLDAQSHQDVPFEQLVERLNVPRSTAHTPLFQIMITTNSDYALNNEQANAFSLPEVTFTPASSNSVVAKFDLNISTHLSEQGVSFQWNYDTALFSSEHIEQISEHLNNLLMALSRADERDHIPVGELSMLSPAEIQHLTLTLNNKVSNTNDEEVLIHQAFEKQAATTPDAIALICGQQKLTYAQLNQQANKLANYLINSKFKGHVGISCPRSPELIIGILGVLKSGLSYIPFEPNNSVTRNSQIIEDANIELVLAHSSMKNSLPQESHTIVWLDQEQSSWRQAQPATSPQVSITKSHSAYVIYTSGSTGTPKGVEVSHSNLLDYCFNVGQGYYQNELDGSLLVTSHGFDIGIPSLFMPLINGGFIDLLSGDEILTELTKKLSENSSNNYLLRMTPNHVSGLLSLLNSDVREEQHVFVIGGESFDTHLAQELQNRFPKSQIFNHYGPTEGTVGCCLYDVTANSQQLPANLPIGRAMVNNQLYVLSQDYSLTPHGAKGELYIGGAGVAKGYINRRELTAERFIANPYYDESNAVSSQYLYRTSDIVQYDSQDNLIYLGRSDNQVKIRGFRIELGDVENQLLALDTIQGAIVLAKDLGTGSQSLVAYIVVPNSLESGEAFIKEVKAQLLGSVPSYMIPAAFVVLPDFPLTPNGKVDKKALPEPEVASLQGEYIAPQTDLETQLQTLWAEILNIPSDSLSIDANFFDIGGHSLLAVKLVSKIRAHLQQEISIAQVFSAPTIKRMAECLTQPSQQQLRSQVTPIPRNEQSHYPLSFSQQRLWFIDQMNGNSSEYNMPVALRVKGTIDTHAVVEAFTQIIQRHEVLRTVYVNTDDGALQHIQQDFSFVLNLHDLTSFDGEEQDKQLQNLIEEDTKAPFDLSQDLMLRASFVLLNQGETPEKQDSVLLFNMHHIASDGWSLEVLTREFMTHYKAITAGEKVQLPQLDIQYVDYALWQRQWLQGEVLDKQLRYWEKQLADTPPVHSLPLDKTRPEVKQHQGDIITKTLPADISKKLIKLAKQHQVTPFMLLHAALALVLSRHSNSHDIVIGTPVANRLQDELAPLIGFFVNTLVLRVNTKQDSLNDYLAHVRQTHLDAQSHQDVPFEQLVERLNVPRSTAHTPLFQIMITTNSDYGEGHRDKLFSLSNLTMTPMQDETLTSKFDLEFNLNITPEGSAISCNYDCALFSQRQVDSLCEHLGNILIGLSKVSNETDISLTDLQMLSVTETNLLVNELHETACNNKFDTCIQNVFEGYATETPDKVALVFGSHTLTYKQLNQQANQLANYLRDEYQVGHEDLVGLCVDRSLDMIVGLLAILKAGACYVPIDSNYPDSRVSYMLNDSELKLVLTQRKYVSRFDPYNRVELVTLDSVNEIEQLSRQSTDNLNSQILNPSSLAYINYTSGSTGQPKGVLIEHRGVLRLLKTSNFIQLTQDSVFLHTANIAFDAATIEIWGPLLNGGTCVIYPEQSLDITSINKVINTYEINSIFLTAGLFKEWSNHKDSLPSLNWIVFGGDVTQPSDAYRIQQQIPQATLINAYGPTENTVVTSSYCIPKLTPAELSIPIGTPIGNDQVLLLDSNNQLVPFGAIGELCVSGPGLARGYLNREQLTEERFITNPYYQQRQDESFKRLYKTGDLARYLPNGNIQFVGRNDGQVKIRGFRIELGEIEHQLNKMDEIDSSIVLIKESDDGDKHIIAYIKVASHISNISQNLKRLRQFLNQVLPTYMVPHAFVSVEQWPLAATGKIDTKLLPKVDFSASFDDYVAPTTKTEQKLAEVWSKILKIETSNISITGDFFELGGHSLLAIRLISAIDNSFGVLLSVHDLFDLRTIQEMSSVIEREQTLAQLKSDIAQTKSVERMEF